MLYEKTRKQEAEHKHKQNNGLGNKRENIKFRDYDFLDNIVMLIVSGTIAFRLIC